MLAPTLAHLAAASPLANSLLEGPQRPAAVAGMICAGLLYLAILAAGLLIMVRAFRVSVVWGLVVMFVPFGALVFVAKHWEETKNPFLVQVACGGIIGAFVAFVLINGNPLPSPAKSAAAAAKPTPHEVRDLAEDETPIPAPRADPNASQRAAYAKHAQDLNVLYGQLNTERGKLGKLKPGSPAIKDFNTKAAKYGDGLKALAEEKTRLDALDRAANLPADAAAALASLQASAASGDYETFAATLRKSLDEYRQTPSFPAITTLARTTLAQATSDKVAAGVKDKAAKAAHADFDKTTRQIQGIVNQTPAIVPKPTAGEVYHYAFHPGANPPDYKAENLKATQEIWKGQYAYMDEAPGVFYQSADCEFNPQLKFFYTNRNVPKKRLNDTEYQELTRLIRLLGQQEQAITKAAPPAGSAERVMAELTTLKARLDGYAMK